MTDAELCKHYQPLVRSIAGHVAKRSHYRAEFDDLLSEGMIGLLEAARTFDPKRGTQFATHAQGRVRGRMLDSIRAMDWVPLLCRKRGTEGAAKRDAHYKATGERTGQAARSHRALKRQDGEKDISDWSAPAALLGSNEFPDKDKRAPNPYVSAEQADSIRALTRGLSRMERFVVLSSVVHGLTLKDVGLAAGLSESRCSQIRTQALGLLGERASAMLGAAMR